MALNCDQRYKWKFLFLRKMMWTKRTSINNAFVVTDFLQSMSYFWWNSFLKHDQPISFCNFIVFNFTSQADTGNSALFLSLLQGWPRPGPCFLFVTTLCVVIMMLTTICNDKNDKRTWSQGLLSWTNLWDGRERVRCSRKAFHVTDYCFHFLKKKNNNNNNNENNQLEQNNWRRSCSIRMYNVDTFQRVSVIDVAITSWIVC